MPKGRATWLDMKMELRKTFQFEAAHLLPRLPKSHKCRRLHGHSFKVDIVVAGECDPKLGWLMDYADITAAFKPIWEKLDHRYLNEMPGLENPTSEDIAVWIWKRLKPRLPLLTEVVVAETCTARRCIAGNFHRSSGAARRPGAGNSVGAGTKRRLLRVQKETVDLPRDLALGRGVEAA